MPESIKTNASTTEDSYLKVLTYVYSNQDLSTIR
jgi:hypothetical protein